MVRPVSSGRNYSLPPTQRRSKIGYNFHYVFVAYNLGHSSISIIHTILNCIVPWPWTATIISTVLAAHVTLQPSTPTSKSAILPSIMRGTSEWKMASTTFLVIGSSTRRYGVYVGENYKTDRSIKCQFRQKIGSKQLIFCKWNYHEEQDQQKQEWLKRDSVERSSYY